jgi:Fe-S-cluster containining protein
MGRLLRMIQEHEATPRIKVPIDPQWRCQRSGDCCTKPGEVVMTKEEAAVLVHHAPPTVTMEFRPEGEFVAMKAGPCPLYAFKSCMVYEHRPYNCRRFGCMRPDVKAEPFDPGGWNMMYRVSISREAAKLARWMQRRAQGWATSHGWKIDA